jgi:hypothetical protein
LSGELLQRCTPKTSFTELFGTPETSESFDQASKVLTGMGDADIGAPKGYGKLFSSKVVITEASPMMSN